MIFMSSGSERTIEGSPTRLITKFGETAPLIAMTCRRSPFGKNYEIHT
jgi:hypothetical protein